MHTLVQQARSSCGPLDALTATLINKMREKFGVSSSKASSDLRQFLGLYPPVVLVRSRYDEGFLSENIEFPETMSWKLQLTLIEFCS